MELERADEEEQAEQGEGRPLIEAREALDRAMAAAGNTGEEDSAEEIEDEEDDGEEYDDGQEEEDDASAATGEGGMEHNHGGNGDEVAFHSGSGEGRPPRSQVLDDLALRAEAAAERVHGYSEDAAMGMRLRAGAGSRGSGSSSGGAGWRGGETPTPWEADEEEHGGRKSIAQAVREVRQSGGRGMQEDPFADNPRGPGLGNAGRLEPGYDRDDEDELDGDVDVDGDGDGNGAVEGGYRTEAGDGDLLSGWENNGTEEQDRSMLSRSAAIRRVNRAADSAHRAARRIEGLRSSPGQDAGGPVPSPMGKAQV